MKTAILAVALALAACSGTRSYVVASASRYPISLSDGLRGPDGALLRPEQKHVVGEFSYNYKTWGMFWTMIAFTGDKDISAEINQQVKDAGAVRELSLGSAAQEKKKACYVPHDHAGGSTIIGLR